MPIFKLFAPKTVRLLGGNILSRNASNLTCNHLDLKNFPGRETPGGKKPRTPAFRGEEAREWRG